jgi:nucleotide-binding universal stress UspA family protein
MQATRSPRLVVGYDGSAAARQAVAVAARRAGPGGAVWVVHAYQAPPDLYDATDAKRWEAERRERGEALLDALLLSGDTGLLDTSCETELIHGPAAAALMSVAREHDADEIVVGSRRLGRVRAMLGSVSRELLAIADRPVVVIPAGALSSSGLAASRRDAGRTAGTRR